MPLRDYILNNAGGIHSDALISLTSNDMTVGPSALTPGNLNVSISNNGGMIGGKASIDTTLLDVTTDVVNIAVGGNANFSIGNSGGSIGSDALITVTAPRYVFTGFQLGPPADLNAYIDNSSGGSIGGNAAVNLTVGANVQTEGGAHVYVNNSGSPGGSIDGSAAVNVNVSGDINTQTDALFSILNGGGTIGSGAAVNVSAANITANSLIAQIDNTGGSIGASTEGGATINMNVSSTASVTNDATVAIYGSDGAVGGVGININGGNYNVGGTFLSYIDGDGTITFNNASAHADVLKAGVFGANGAVNISGGTLSADTTLKLYAPGSNGQLNFMSNVTLGGNSVKILAANSVTIFNNVVVTIGGPNPADVYTGFTGEIPNANYTGFGGNGSTTGTFAGAGANNPQPLSNAPAFDDPPPATVATTSRTTSTSVKSSTLSTSSGTTSTKLSSQTLSSTTVTSSDKIVDRNLKTTSKTGTGSTINISDSNQVLSLLDGVAAGPDGKVTVSGSKSSSNLKNLSGMNSNGLSSGERRMIIQQMREHGTTRIAGKRIL